MKFKIDDKVRIISDNVGLAPVGEIATITIVDVGRTNYPYFLDDSWWMGEDEIELANLPPRTFIGHPNGELEVKSGPTETLGQLDTNVIRTFNSGATRDTTQGKLDLEVKKVIHGHPRFYEILEQMKELHSRKNHDYAGTSDPLKNLRACERLELAPFIGVMVRLQDKWSRLEEFIKSGQLMVKNESVIDTLMDNAVYSVLAIILYEEQQKVDRTKPVPGGY